MNYIDIKKELLESFIDGGGERQERAILKAVRDIGDLENKAGMFSAYTIELRDFLLDYIKCEIIKCDKCDIELDTKDSIGTSDNKTLCDSCYTKLEIELNN